MNNFDLFKKIVVSNKSENMVRVNNSYTAYFDVRAKKKDIADIIEKIYGLKVLKVRTMICRGKIKRNKYFRKYKRPNLKKALIQLKEGDVLPNYLGEGSTNQLKQEEHISK